MEVSANRLMSIMKSMLQNKGKPKVHIWLTNTALVWTRPTIHFKISPWSSLFSIRTVSQARVSSIQHDLLTSALYVAKTFVMSSAIFMKSQVAPKRKFKNYARMHAIHAVPANWDSNASKWTNCVFQIGFCRFRFFLKTGLGKWVNSFLWKNWPSLLNRWTWTNANGLLKCLEKTEPI